MFGFVWWLIRWSFATALLLAVMAGAGWFVFSRAVAGGELITVPDVGRLPLTEASYLLTAKGLILGEQTEIFRGDIPAYHVVAQRPAPGKVVRAGRKVYLTVSAGQKFEAAPVLAGKNFDEARRVMELERFRLGTPVARIPHHSDRDTVLAQDPPAGERVERGGKINLLLSDGPTAQSMIMPDLRGMEVQEVVALLSARRLEGLPVIVERPGEPLDVVLNQEPVPGAIVRGGDRVRYEVNPSGAVGLPNAQRTVQVKYTVPGKWDAHELRVVMVDRRGVRQALRLDALNPEAETLQVISGETVTLNDVKFIDELTVEFYLDGGLDQSIRYRGDASPVTTRHGAGDAGEYDAEDQDSSFDTGERL